MIDSGAIAIRISTSVNPPRRFHERRLFAPDLVSAVIGTTFAAAFVTAVAGRRQFFRDVEKCEVVRVRADPGNQHAERSVAGIVLGGRAGTAVALTRTMKTSMRVNPVQLTMGDGPLVFARRRGTGDGFVLRPPRIATLPRSGPMSSPQDRFRTVAAGCIRRATLRR